jgi:DeoR family ulaG and ulaABCDEF operon transcriptional repressor
MEADPLIVQSETKLLKRAEQLVVLADSRKFRQRSSMIVAGIERISTLITDQGATEEELDPFRRANIRVIQVAALAEGDPTPRGGIAQPNAS